MKTIYLVLFLLMSVSFTSCDMLGLEEEEQETETAVNAGYNFSFTCPAGSTNSVPIPAASTQCQDAYEYFAKMYGCNESDYFNEANCRMCTDCGLQNYCSICD